MNRFIRLQICHDLQIKRTNSAHCFKGHFTWFLSGKLPVFIGTAPSFQNMSAVPLSLKGYLRRHLKSCYMPAALVTEILQFEVWCCLFFFTVIGALTFIFTSYRLSHRMMRRNDEWRGREIIEGASRILAKTPHTFLALRLKYYLTSFRKETCCF